MLQLFRLFLGVSLLKKGPQDVPYSLFLFVILFLIVFVLDVIGMQVPDSKGNAFAMIDILRYLVIDKAIILSVIFLIFHMHGYKNRYLQSITAIYGFEFLLETIHLPLNLFTVQVAADNPNILVLVFFVYMFLFGWLLMVVYHVLRQALSITMLHAAVLSVGLFSLDLYIGSLLLPELSS